MNLLVFAVVLSALLVGSSFTLKAADHFTICRRSDPLLNDCIKSTLHQLRPALKKGVAALQIPSFEPLVVPRIVLRQGAGPVSFASTFTRTHIEGITDYAVQAVAADVGDYRIDITVALPSLYVHGDYEVSGRILVLPISGTGDSWSNYTDVTATLSLIGHPESRGGQEYMKLDELQFGMNVKHALIHMNNLFGGNKQLGDVMNRFISENWELFFAEMKPVVDSALSILLKSYVERVFDKFPYAELFLS